MRLLNDNELTNEYRNIYSFLEENNFKWIKRYFLGVEEFLDFIDDENVHFLAYKNENNDLCCVGILFENAILIVGFSKDVENEDTFKTMLGDTEKLVSELGYTCVLYGEGYYSYGVYNGDEENKFDNFLEANGYIVETISYDIRHKVSSIRKSNTNKGYEVSKIKYDVFKNKIKSKDLNSIEKSIMLDFYRYPSDTCYITTKAGEEDVLGYAFLDPKSYVIDHIKIKETTPSSYNEVKEELMIGIANDLNGYGVDSFVEQNVGSTESQKINNEFEVCGKYKTLSKELL